MNAGVLGGVLAAAALSLAALALAGVPPRTPPPVVELVETRPVETALGNPALPEAALVWRAMIDSARVSLDIEQFYISTWPGEALEPVLDAVRRAAARGVRVRVLVDARMHRTYPQPVDSLGLLPGIAVRTIDMGELGGVQHAKFFLVDGREFFVGSQNFDWRALSHIHELGVRVRDRRLTAQVAEVFAADWARGVPVGRDPPIPGPAGATLHGRLFATVAGRGDGERFSLSASPRAWLGDSLDWDRDAIVRVLDGAQRTIVVQSLTFSPSGHGVSDSTLFHAIARAAARGVSVRLLISEWVTASADGMTALHDLARLPHIEVKLSTLPRWTGGYIPFARVEHCKYAVADDATLWIGTSNWDPSYFHTSRNLGLTCESPALAAQAARVFASSWFGTTAAPLDPAHTYTPLAHGLTSPDGSPVYGQ